MIELINTTWGWTGMKAQTVFSTNAFAHMILCAEDGQYWKICPEELDCSLIAKDKTALHSILADSDFAEYWEMFDLIQLARTELGDLQKGEKYCLKLPIPLGGLYEPSNLGKIDHEKLISFSAQMAQHIQNTPEGESFKIQLDDQL